MRFNPIPLITCCLVMCLQSMAQSSLSADTSKQFLVQLQSRTILPEANLNTVELAGLKQRVEADGKSIVVLQFSVMPGASERIELKKAGIELLDYIPNYAFTALISKIPDVAKLQRLKVRSVFTLMPEDKMQAELAHGMFPAYAVKLKGTVDLILTFATGFVYDSILQTLRSYNVDILSTQFKEQHVLRIRCSTANVRALAALPWVEFIQAAPPGDQVLNAFSRINSRANILNKPLPAGGRQLTGQGVTIGIGDDADPYTHVDFSGRRISRAAAPANYHGTHVTGTAGGAGIWNELYAGYAPKATLLNQFYSGIWINTSKYWTDHRMVVTNNSYGNESVDCAYYGFYDFSAKILDQLAINYPKVTHVFAAGNSGIGFPMDCAPYNSGFKTVLGGYQASKNVLTVGNTYADGVIFPQSSRGPVLDGRIKPEVAAQGAFVLSTSTFADYSYNTGTSMAAPAVAGAIALLVERYRQINGPASDIDNALTKALICNSADDRGNPGPDYSYGFGTLNALRAVETLEANRFVSDIFTTTGENTFNINVPANTAQLKVMLYWNDAAGSMLSSRALINDLDLRVTNTAPATFLPLVLDGRPGFTGNNAQPGIDTLNNIEQVVVNNPSGTYTIHVKATALPFPSQQYYVVYDFVPVATTLTFPTGAEKLIPGEQILLNWDAYGGPAETYKLEYSADNGVNWSVINAAVASNLRFLLWNVPSTPTNEARVRITRNNTAMVSTSDPFTVLGAPALNLSANQCEGSISVDWTNVAGATHYEVMKLKNDEMLSVATVPAGINTYTINGLSKDSIYWVTVRAINNGFAGRRDTAVNRKPDNGNCTGIQFDNDLKLDTILAPGSSGRLFTATSLTNAEPVTIRIKNLDDASSSSPIDVRYYINNVLQDAQSISPSIPAGGTYLHTFSIPADLSAIGTYVISASIKKSGDNNITNDSLVKAIRQLDNSPIVLPYNETFDAAPIQSFNTKQVGLTGLDRYDFANSGPLGRIRTFINTGMSYSGNRAITLDAERFNPGVADSLTGTYNIDLSGYNPATDEIRLDFRYKNHGQVANAANNVWIRGSDQDSWKPAYDLAANQRPVDGTYRFSKSIEVSDLLAAPPTQTFSPSFQVRWGQAGQHQAADDEGGAGYTFDNIRLYKVTDDMQLISIDAPVTSSCGLTANTPVSITVRNSRNSTVSNVPVRYRVNAGPWVNDIVPSIAANASVPFTFGTAANLAGIANYLIEAEVDYPSDTFFDNDTLSKTVTNLPIITSFPYLENFEAGPGYWYTGGKLSSWEFGTPASIKITRAASGSSAWKTRLNGTYNDLELSYLYSPCFNVSSMTNPSLSFSVAFDIEDCGGTLCDGAYMEYSLDGNTWNRLGANGQGVNWYNKLYPGNPVWSDETYDRWHVATIPLSVTGVPIANMNQIRFRFVMTSDQALNKDGIAVDDIHVYDNIYGIYDGPTLGAPVTNSIPGGTGWVNFLSGSNQLIASVNSPVVNMGLTSVQAFINPSAVRYTTTQYYHDRNITIKPSTIALGNDSATVRFYFLDTETEALLNATGCPACTKPSMAYELGVSKYSDANDNFENGNLNDDLQGDWLFINASKAVKVPFDKGYYAEFKVRDFSEFWLNNGGFTLSQPLPLQLLNFTARKENNNDVLLNWVTASEQHINRYEIEVAVGNDGLQQNRFVKIGEVFSQGNSTTQQQYRFTDLTPLKSGVRYYRLRILENDGTTRYSTIRPVVFDQYVNWQVYPNPSPGIFNLAIQADNGTLINIRIINANGQVVRTTTLNGTGFLQKQVIDLQDRRYAPGLFLMEVQAGDVKQTYRLVKQ